MKLFGWGPNSMSTGNRGVSPFARVGPLFQAPLLCSHSSTISFKNANCHHQLDGEGDQTLGAQVRQEIQWASKKVGHHKAHGA